MNNEYNSISNDYVDVIQSIQSNYMIGTIDNPSFIKGKLSKVIGGIRKTLSKKIPTLKDGISDSVYYFILLLTIEDLSQDSPQKNSSLEELIDLDLNESSKDLIKWLRNNNTYKLEDTKISNDILKLFIHFMDIVPNVKNIDAHKMNRFKWYNFNQLIVIFPDLMSALWPSDTFDSMPNELKIAILWAKLNNYESILGDDVSAVNKINQALDGLSADEFGTPNPISIPKAQKIFDDTKVMFGDIPINPDKDNRFTVKFDALGLWTGLE